MNFRNNICNCLDLSRNNICNCLELSRNNICNCLELAKNLIIFSREILDIREPHLQWEKFETFAKQNLCHISEINGSSTQSCSSVFYTKLLMQKYEWSTRKLSTILLNIISLIYLKLGYYYTSCGSPQNWIGSNIFKNIYKTFRVINALNGRSEYMKLLINSDLLSSEKDHPIFEYFTRNNLKNFMHRMDSSGRWTSTAPNVSSLIQDVFRRNNCESFKRIYFTSIVIQAVQFNLESEAMEYVHCLRMYFTTIRDPFLTINEVRIMFYVCLFVLDKLHLFESFYENFIKLMPECSVKLQPRNLIDLTRCQIRENLKTSNLSLPKAVENLSLPQLMKDFVLGDVIEVSPKRGIVSPEQILTESRLAELVSLKRRKI